MDRALRAQVLMAEAIELGVTIDDLLVAARTLGARHVPMTVAEYLEAIAPTFSPGTAATYGTYWRLAVARFGDRRLAEVTFEDCAAVVAEAVRRGAGLPLVERWPVLARELRERADGPCSPGRNAPG